MAPVAVFAKAASTTRSGFSFPKFGKSATTQGKSLKKSTRVANKRAPTPTRKVLPPGARPKTGYKFDIALPRQLFLSPTEGSWKIPVELGFTKANELFVGRAAMIGFASSLLGEALTGKGPLAQFDIETGINLLDTEYAVLALIGFNLFAALVPAKGEFVPDVPQTPRLP